MTNQKKILILPVIPYLFCGSVLGAAFSSIESFSEKLFLSVSQDRPSDSNYLTYNKTPSLASQGDVENHLDTLLNVINATDPCYSDSFIKNCTENKIGIFLVHRHQTLKDNEIMLERLGRNLKNEKSLISKGMSLTELRHSKVDAVANSWIVTDDGDVYEFEYSERCLINDHSEERAVLIQQLLTYIKKAGLTTYVGVTLLHRNKLTANSGQRYSEETYINKNGCIESALRLVPKPKHGDQEAFKITRVLLNHDRQNNCVNYTCVTKSWGHDTTLIGH